MASSVVALLEVNKLTKMNFSLWKIKIEVLLRAKCAWKIVTGEEKKPTNIVDQITWEKKDNIAIGILKLSISDSLLSYVDGVESS